MTNVLILGAGYAGIRAAKTLDKFAPQGTNITIIDQNELHEERTLIHEVAAGTALSEGITFPITKALPKEINFVQAKVSKIDIDAKQVEFTDHEAMAYDYVVIALGFRSEDFGTPGAAENALPLDSVATAEKIYQTIEAHVAAFSTTHDEKDLSIIVAGAGFTGVELLGELIDTAKHLQKKYNTPQIKITSMEMMTRILPMFDSKLADYAMKYLKNHHINMMTGARITQIEPDAVVYQTKDSDEDKRVYGNTIIWTVGVSGSDVIKVSGFDARRNRVTVTDKLNLQDHPEVYIIGDDSAVMDPSTNRPYPTTAQISASEGDQAGKNIAFAIEGKPLETFKYKNKGTVASLGQGDGIAQLGKNTKLQGYLAKVMKKIVADKSFLDDASLGIMFKKFRWPL